MSNPFADPEDEFQAKIHCMCGSPMDSHGVFDGHSPISMFDYAEMGRASNVRSLPAPAARIFPKAALADYLERVYPARRHGATDCGECCDTLSDADHMLQWLAERGLAVVNVKRI